jgi:hypothetical protein
MTIRTGGCLCGAIRYELVADPTYQVACHCRACQYVNGGSPTLAMIVPRSALKITKGEPRTYWSTAESGRQVGRSFCAECGTPVFSEPSGNPDIAVIKVGSLDDPSDFKVQADIWMKEAQPWQAPHEGAVQMPGNPGG